MKVSSNPVKKILVVITLLFSSLLVLVQAQEPTQGFISDDLTIFMHAGPGTNYRILGTINAGSQIKTTGKSDKGYSEIIDDKNRITWVETKYLTTKPGLRFVVAKLNSKAAQTSDYNNQLDGEVNDLKSTVASLTQEKKQLQSQLNEVQQQLKTTISKVKNQDAEILAQRFYNGAIVLVIGLLFGLILPKFFARRRSNMDSWS